MRPPISQAVIPFARRRRFHYDLYRNIAVRMTQITASTAIGAKNSAFRYLLFSSLYRFSSSSFHNLPSITTINTQFFTGNHDQDCNEQPQRCSSHLQNVADDCVLKAELPLLVQLQCSFACFPVGGEVDGFVSVEGLVEYHHLLIIKQAKLTKDNQGRNLDAVVRKLV